MSDNQSHRADDAHTGPINSPKQMLWFSVMAFVLPVVVIIGLVYFVTSSMSSPASSAGSAMDVARRIQKVGTVDLSLGPVNRPAMSGEEVYKAQCATCHATGVAGAPHFGDAAQWGPRLSKGFDLLLTHALKGFNAMAPQGGGQFTDLEVARAVVYMSNQAGGKFAEPAAPAASAASAAGEAAAPASEAAPAAAASTATAAPAASATATTASAAAPVAAAAATVATAAATAGAAVSADAGKALYDKACVTCHAAGVAGAPKLGDKAAWAPRIAKGDEALLKSSIDGLNAMPPRGASTATDDELKAAIAYMVAAAK